MIMTKEKRFIEKEDLIVFEEYAKNRKKIRKDLVEFKKNRRVSIGPYATFYFESFETMLAQVQEMLHIEKGGDEQLKDELNAYNPLIPKGKELVATLMFEIDDPTLRADFFLESNAICIQPVFFSRSFIFLQGPDLSKIITGKCFLL